MADIAELHQEARELLSRQHNKLISQQVALVFHLPQHSCHQLCQRTPDDRSDRRRSPICRSKPNIQQYLAEEPLNNTSYKSFISSIHKDAVRTAIESSSSKLLKGRPRSIATAEQSLPRKTRTIMAQLRTDHSLFLGQYMNRIVPTARNHFHDCGHSSHYNHHSFDCLSKPTTLTVESFWTSPTTLTVESCWTTPTESAKHHNLAIDEGN